ncbi:DUF1194 domain-containing protein [Maritimibacter sp. DP1N21-5]|uniref:DUF1194 domain-containing protein n=1 Tax=Maritimibacter sp. DP1N21-5 TaxID=2836867 RepID=UPI001C480DFF|nr:DUF1194 domain-containing protein [Maritimibacter sp. DP1N21-5]MBV7409081.1 DUF1194 domain-containing protein [Maritimibacter sp. DP1N21-5]
MKAALLIPLLVISSPVHAQDVPVDLELVLMVDVSRSMSPTELEIQRTGYVEALRSDEVHEAILSGYQGRIAVTYVEWAGSQQVIVPWRLLETREDLIALADDLSVTFNPSLRRTSISEALHFGAALFQDNGYMGDRTVIDISGDGPNNQGRYVNEARDAVVAQGVTINGLPLMTRDGMGADWSIDHLDLYYETCVIGGIGAFVLPVYDWEDFPEAVKRKMVMEIFIGEGETPENPERLVPIQYRDSTDCQIGEKMWEARRGIWAEP